MVTTRAPTRVTIAVTMTARRRAARRIAAGRRAAGRRAARRRAAAAMTTLNAASKPRKGASASPSLSVSR